MIELFAQAWYSPLPGLVPLKTPNKINKQNLFIENLKLTQKHFSFQGRIRWSEPRVGDTRCRTILPGSGGFLCSPWTSLSLSCASANKNLVNYSLDQGPHALNFFLVTRQYHDLRDDAANFCIHKANLRQKLRQSLSHSLMWFSTKYLPWVLDFSCLGIPKV